MTPPRADYRRSGDFAKLLRLCERLQLLQRLVLDLADPLAGDVEGPPDLVEGARMLAAESVAQLEHAPLAVGEVLERLAQGLIGDDLGRAERKLVTELGREPTPEEIAEHTGIDPEEVESIKRSAQAPVSLEKPVGDEEESEFGQFIADERAESPYERAAEILTKEALREALENLSYRERRVLELRYGLGGEHPRTLDEVGRTFNVTRERIRQIENQSLKKLQSLAEAQKLRDVA
jgi:DNA-directed RNA polymerase sigma subunit (sigma70/sigma32)